MTKRNLWAHPWTVIAVSAGIVMILIGLFALALNSSFIVFTQSLQVDGFQSDGEGGYSAVVFEGDVRVAAIYVRFPSLVYGGLTQVPMRVSIWHESARRLHSMMLVFASNDFLSIALEVPDGYPWLSLDFHRAKSDMKGVEFYVSDLGVQGTGTVTLDFFVRMQSSQQRMNFSLYAQIITQKNGPLVFSRELAEAETSIESQRV